MIHQTQRPIPLTFYCYELYPLFTTHFVVVVAVVVFLSYGRERCGIQQSARRIHTAHNWNVARLLVFLVFINNKQQAGFPTQVANLHLVQAHHIILKINNYIV